MIAKKIAEMEIMIYNAESKWHDPGWSLEAALFNPNAPPH